MQHATTAAELAASFEKGDAQERVKIARECEEQGILAVLVARRLRGVGLEEEFGAVERGVDTGRGR